MRVYPQDPSFFVQQAVTVCVEPNNTFSLAFFRQDSEEALVPVGSQIRATDRVTRLGRARVTGNQILRSDASSSAMRYDQDWGWPSATFSIDADKGSDCYVAVAFNVDTNGSPTDALGRKIIQGEPIYPRPDGGTDDTQSMALIVGKSQFPDRPVAYIVPIATYHAYNVTGGGCFYGYQASPATPAITTVTMRRPGGGLGAWIREPPDPYDTASPRQQFAHWDAKFIRWMKSRNPTIPCDFYTDLDLHLGTVPPGYEVIVSAGHHEYWSQDMRNNLGRLLQPGGDVRSNYACFSGNTCYRPISFGAYRTSGFMTSVVKLADAWPDDNNESSLIGLAWKYGGGKWGTWSGGQWTNTERDPCGYILSSGKESHWVFAGTGLRANGNFGKGTANALDGRIVGYEADGVPSNSTFLVLALSDTFTNWNDGTGRKAALGLLGNDNEQYKLGMVFNCGTTDWARILGDREATDFFSVSKITENVLRKFLVRGP